MDRNFAKKLVKYSTAATDTHFVRPNDKQKHLSALNAAADVAIRLKEDLAMEKRLVDKKLDAILIAIEGHRTLAEKYENNRAKYVDWIEQRLKERDLVYNQLDAAPVVLTLRAQRLQFLDTTFDIVQTIKEENKVIVPETLQVDRSRAVNTNLCRMDTEYMELSNIIQMFVANVQVLQQQQEQEQEQEQPAGASSSTAGKEDGAAAAAASSPPKKRKKYPKKPTN